MKMNKFEFTTPVAFKPKNPKQKKKAIDRLVKMGYAKIAIEWKKRNTK